RQAGIRDGMPVSSLARVEIEFCDRVDRHREPEQQTQCEAAECEEAGAGTGLVVRCSHIAAAAPVAPGEECAGDDQRQRRGAYEMRQQWPLRLTRPAGQRITDFLVQGPG